MQWEPQLRGKFWWHVLHIYTCIYTYKYVGIVERVAHRRKDVLSYPRKGKCSSILDTMLSTREIRYKVFPCIFEDHYTSWRLGIKRQGTCGPICRQHTRRATSISFRTANSCTRFQMLTILVYKRRKDNFRFFPPFFACLTYIPRWQLKSEKNKFESKKTERNILIEYNHLNFKFKDA